MHQSPYIANEKSHRLTLADKILIAAGAATASVTLVLLYIFEVRYA